MQEQAQTPNHRHAVWQRCRLIFMAVGFIASLPFKENDWVFWLQSGFEAGLVGGIADWFAITALFRHPLGLKIPHTNLLPKNRERVIESIVQMLEKDLLNKESIVEKLRHMTLADRFIKLLRSIVLLPAFRSTVMELLTGILHKLPREAILKVVDERISDTVKAYPSKRLAERLMELNDERRLDELAIDQLLGYGQRLLEDPVIRDQIGRLAYHAMIDQEKNTFLRVTAKDGSKSLFGRTVESRHSIGPAQCDSRYETGPSSEPSGDSRSSAP